MNDIDLKKLASQVKRNCNISDAKYWGNYSICGLLLRLRELYRVEKNIKPWEKIHQQDIGEWITERERLWKQLEEEDYIDICVNGNVYKPFEVENINSELEKAGLVYGAGFGIYMKPSFFIADLLSREKINGFEVYIAGNEYARDLSDYPATFQDNYIVARVDTTKLLLWQRFEELRCNRTKNPLVFAFSKYGISPEDELSMETDKQLSAAARSEVDTYIRHELGEALEGERMGDEWKILLSILPHSKAEVFTRSVKDILSDTTENGMLRYIIDNKKEGSLGFYIVFLSGFRKILFPEIIKAFGTFSDTGNWSLIDNARKRGYERATGYADRLLSLYRKHKSDDNRVQKHIEEEIMNGLF